MSSSPTTSQQPQGFSTFSLPEGSGVMRVDSLPEVMRTEAGFLSHFLIEVVPNAIYDMQWHPKDLKRPGFPRGDYTTKNAPVQDAIAYYASTNVYHVEEHGGWVSGGSRAWIRGPNKAVLLAFPLADYRRYPRLVIDTTLPVRGLYFPQLFSEPHYEGLCRMSQVLFYKHDFIHIPTKAANFQEVAHWDQETAVPLWGELYKMSDDKGLHYFEDRCLDIRIAELMLALSIDSNLLQFIEIPFLSPPHKPSQNSSEKWSKYEHPAFQYMNSLSPHEVGEGGAPYHQIPKDDFGPYHAWMAAYISKNEGLQYVPGPTDKNILEDVIKTLVGSALNLIPVVGPLASISWSLIADAITDPDKIRELGNLTDVEADIVKLQLEEVAKLVEGSKNRKYQLTTSDDSEALWKKAVKEAIAEENREAHMHALPVGKPGGVIMSATNQEA
ncbi:hypothetical protein ACLX1H_007846 [Fusarium chlamydosporum]